jgi:hypothetical protein
MQNLGNLDRIVRAVLGVALIILALTAGWPLWAVAASMAVGAILAVTAGIGFCPLYWALRLNTRRASQH